MWTERLSNGKQNVISSYSIFLLALALKYVHLFKTQPFQHEVCPYGNSLLTLNLNHAQKQN